MSPGRADEMIVPGGADDGGGFSPALGRMLLSGCAQAAVRNEDHSDH
jgi:hypothetical protein